MKEVLLVFVFVCLSSRLQTMNDGCVHMLAYGKSCAELPNIMLDIFQVAKTIALLLHTNEVFRKQ